MIHIALVITAFVVLALGVSLMVLVEYPPKKYADQKWEKTLTNHKTVTLVVGSVLVLLSLVMFVLAWQASQGKELMTQKIHKMYRHSRNKK